MKVLVVDDQRDVADSIAMVLRLHSHEVETASTGRDALAVADRWKPDVVLLDISMPEMSGYDLARKLRDYRRAPRPVLVAVTGFGASSDKLASRQAGIDHHLVKPVDPERLLSLLQSLARDS